MNSLTFEGVDLSSPEFGLTVIKSPQVFGATPRIESPEVPYAYGSLLNMSGYKPRSIVYSALIEAQDEHGDIQTQIDRLNVLLCRSTPGILENQRVPDRYWMAVLESPIEGAYAGSLQAPVTLKFLCPDPRAWGKVLYTLGGSGTFEIDMSNKGSAHADPIWTVTSATDPIDLWNKTTGEHFYYYTGGAGGTVIIDSRRDYQVCRLTPTGDALTAGALGLYPRLMPGVINTIQCSGSASAEFYARYL